MVQHHSATDEAFMRHALALARRGLGRVAPNPAVGCVLVAEGERGPQVIGTGFTQAGGRPHAEQVAILEARAKAPNRLAGSTAYVTLEPCAHHGVTPPCAEALIEAGVVRVVIAVRDPDPRVNGGGAARLRATGIEVVEGVLEREAQALNAGFLSCVEKGRPLVTLKLASSLDARTAMASGESKWITGPEARAAGHALRAEHDAIMVGSVTAITDDPDLTCRLPGLEDRSPVRIVADGRLRLPLTAKLVRSARQTPVILFTFPDSERARRQAYRDAGVDVVEIRRDPDGLMDMSEALAALGVMGLTRVLVEGGARLAATLIRDGVVDRIVHFQAGRVLGGDAHAGIASLGFERLAEAPVYSVTGMRRLGDDTEITYEKAG